ncbi:MAG: hypothetical protein EPN86_00475 [Nanoarchaeota archaeon]|nr:MAG: hypothetical protein EPN86_00475 [Nanoarchaeota archaeon]
MKAKLFGIVTVLAILMSVAVLADVDVHGIVYQSDNSTFAGSGIEVTVECDNGDSVVSDVVQTDVNSEYDKLFDTADCGLGDTVFASVPGDEQSKEVTSGNVVLDNLYIVPINLSVPEFSAIAASVAFAGAGVGFLALRRRK